MIKIQILEFSNQPSAFIIPWYPISFSYGTMTCLISCIVNFLLKGFVAERKGDREDMQDAHVIMDDFTGEFDEDDLPAEV